MLPDQFNLVFDVERALVSVQPSLIFPKKPKQPWSKHVETWFWEIQLHTDLNHLGYRGIFGLR